MTLTGRAADGCGLSRDDARPPREMDGAAGRGPLAAVVRPVVAGLAVAGRSGALVSPFRGTPAEGSVRAKTGSVRETRALSGCLTTAGGRPVVFSLVVNSNPVPPAVIAAMDGLVASMVAFPT